MYAKSNPPKTIFEHNEDLVKNYDILKRYISPQLIEKYDKYLQKMLELHDYGKINTRFQNKLGICKNKIPKELTDIPEVPHEWLSLAFIPKNLKEEILNLDANNFNLYNVLRYSIAFHHTRNEIFDKNDFKSTVEYDLERNKHLLGIKYALNKLLNLTNLENSINDNFENIFEYLVLFKGILHKCDFSASAGTPCETEYKGNYQNDLKIGLQKRGIKELKPFQKNAKNLSDKNVILIASTGIGKTEYSMNWIKGNKAFYLLGIRIAVNAMHKRFADFFSKENVALLHGDISYFLTNETDSKNDYDHKMSKAKQLSYPLTIATADQMVTSVFKYNGFELPYLVASYSKVVVDEIQSFAPESIACIVVFLQEVSHLGAKFLIMTATLPPFIKEEFKNIAHFENPQLSEKKRHKIEVLDMQIEDYDFEKIQSNNVLVICNTVSKAQKIYEKLKEKKPKLLHSKFINKHRNIKEKTIMKCTKVIWITTQIVEASLDIDFDLLLTECCTIDGLLQRFGRCYRNREYSGEKPNILIFEFDNNSKKIYDINLLQKSFDILKEDYNKKLLTEEDKQNMIEKVFQDIEKTNYYEKYKKYKELLKSGFRTSKNDAHELFRKITNTHNVIPEPVYSKNKEEIDALILQIEKSINLERIKLIEKLNKYCVSLQIFPNKAKDIVKPLPVESKYIEKSGIKMLKGVEYTFAKGIVFLKDYKDMDNFIL